MRPPALVVLLLGAMLLAGCAAPDAPQAEASASAGAESAAGASPPAVNGRLVQAQPPVWDLRVVDLTDGEVLLNFTNHGDTPVDLAHAGFALEDATGARWLVNASRTAGLADALLDGATVFPDRSHAGRLAFDFEELTMPTTLRFAAGQANATWLLHVSEFPVEIEPADDTSFGAPIRVPGNATLSYSFRDANRPVDVCVILDADHEWWHAEGEPVVGHGCRVDATEGEAGVLVPAGAYNVGMACPAGDEPCRFTLTVLATW